MKTIKDFIRQPPGWVPQPIEVFPDDQVGYLNIPKGIHLIASIRDYGKFRVIHASLTPIHTIENPPSVEELLYQTGNILFEFFGDRGFAMRPLDERRPQMRHYFSIIEKEEER